MPPELLSAAPRASIKRMGGTVEGTAKGGADTDGNSKVSAGGGLSYEGDFGKITASGSGTAVRDREGNVKGGGDFEVKYTKEW